MSFWPKPSSYCDKMLWLVFGLTAALGLASDLVTKYVAVSFLSGGDVVQAVPGWLHFEYTVNHGAVFGIGQGMRPVFLVVSVCALFFLVYLLGHSGRQRFQQFILGLLTAGVLGNLYDRAIYGHVRDMLHALPGWYWPEFLYKWTGWSVFDQPVFPYIFNMADVYLCCGVTLMLLHGFFAKPVEISADGAVPEQAKQPVQ